MVAKYINFIALTSGSLEDLVVCCDKSIPCASLAAEVHHLVNLGLEVLRGLRVTEIVHDDGGVGELQDGQAVVGLAVAEAAAEQVNHRLDSVLHQLLRGK